MYWPTTRQALGSFSGLPPEPVYGAPPWLEAYQKFWERQQGSALPLPESEETLIRRMAEMTDERMRELLAAKRARKLREATRQAMPPVPPLPVASIAAAPPAAAPARAAAMSPAPVPTATASPQREEWMVSTADSPAAQSPQRRELSPQVQDKARKPPTRRPTVSTTLSPEPPAAAMPPARPPTAMPAEALPPANVPAAAMPPAPVPTAAASQQREEWMVSTADSGPWARKEGDSQSAFDERREWRASTAGEAAREAAPSARFRPTTSRARKEGEGDSPSATDEREEWRASTAGEAAREAAPSARFRPTTSRARKEGEGDSQSATDEREEWRASTADSGPSGNLREPPPSARPSTSRQGRITNDSESASDVSPSPRFDD